MLKKRTINEVDFNSLFNQLKFEIVGYNFNKLCHNCKRERSKLYVLNHLFTSERPICKKCLQKRFTLLSEDQKEYKEDMEYIKPVNKSLLKREYRTNLICFETYQDCDQTLIKVSSLSNRFKPFILQADIILNILERSNQLAIIQNLKCSYPVKRFIICEFYNLLNDNLFKQFIKLHS